VKSLLVLGKEYKLKITKDGLPEGAAGVCDPKALTITIHPDQTGIDFWDTLIHELDHAIKFESGQHQIMEISLLEISAEMSARVITENFHLIPKQSKRLCAKCQKLIKPSVK
jgi:hypothetical protein